MTNEFDLTTIISGLEYIARNINLYSVNWAVPFVVFSFLSGVQILIAFREKTLTENKKERLNRLAENKIDEQTKKLKQKLGNEQPR